MLSEFQVVVAIWSEIRRRIRRFGAAVNFDRRGHSGNAMAGKAARSETARTTAASSGILWQCASGADADGQGVEQNTRLHEGKDGTVGFILSDVDPDFDDLDPMKELKQYGRVAKEMEELGVILD